jgi:hypothetical protein
MSLEFLLSMVIVPKRSKTLFVLKEAELSGYEQQMPPHF